MELLERGDMSGDQERFENLIRNLLSSDNATRSDAEVSCCCVDNK